MALSDREAQSLLACPFLPPSFPFPPANIFHLTESNRITHSLPYPCQLSSWLHTSSPLFRSLTSLIPCIAKFLPYIHNSYSRDPITSLSSCLYYKHTNFYLILSIFYSLTSVFELVHANLILYEIDSTTLM